MFFPNCHSDTLRFIRSRQTSSTAVILATGSSINNQDGFWTLQHDFFTLSNAFLHPHIDQIAPLLHAFCAYHPPLLHHEYLDWTRSSLRYLPSTTSLLTPLSNRYNIHQSALARTKFVNTVSPRIYPLFPYLPSASFIPVPQSGPLLLLPLLLQAGYTTVLLLGCDHNQLQNYRKDFNHFYPASLDIRSNSSSANGWAPISVELRSLLSLFNNYHAVRKLARYHNASIYNCSPISWLDVFPFRSYCDFL